MFQHLEELYKKFLRHEIKNEKDLIKHIVVNEIYPSITCSRCSRRLDARVKNIKIKYRCNFCQKEVVHPVVFSEIKTKLMLHQQIQLLVYFVQNLSLKQIKCFTRISMPTIIGFFKEIRKIIYKYFKKIYLFKIGGKNHLVQIDETHFSRRKYNRGRKREVKIFFGAIDTLTKEVRFKGIRKKTTNILKKCIENFIANDSTVHSDKFTSYLSYFKNNNQYNHDSVNHSKHFVDPITKVHTQMIESLWFQLKKFLRRNDYKNNKNLKYFIKEFEFRRMFFGEDGFIMFQRLMEVFLNK